MAATKKAAQAKAQKAADKLAQEIKEDAQELVDATQASAEATKPATTEPVKSEPAKFDEAKPVKLELTQREFALLGRLFMMGFDIDHLVRGPEYETLHADNHALEKKLVEIAKSYDATDIASILHGKDVVAKLRAQRDAARRDGQDDGDEEPLFLQKQPSLAA